MSEINYKELRKDLYEKFHKAYEKLYISELKDENDLLKKRIRDLEGQHKGLVAVNAVLRERPDLPIERLPVAREIAKIVVEMAMLRDENEKLKSALEEYAQDFNMSLQIDKQKDAERNRLHDIAIFLFGVLDDIDTASDEAKNNHEWYRKRVEHLHRKRFEVMETDGYTVKVKK